MIEIIGNIIIKQDQEPINTLAGMKLVSANINEVDLSNVLDTKKLANPNLSERDYYVGDIRSNDDCAFSETQQITLYTSGGVGKFKISFDDYYNIYPSEISISVEKETTGGGGGGGGTTPDEPDEPEQPEPDYPEIGEGAVYFPYNEEADSIDRFGEANEGSAQDYTEGKSEVSFSIPSDYEFGPFYIRDDGHEYKILEDGRSYFEYLKGYPDAENIIGFYLGDIYYELIAFYNSLTRHIKFTIRKNEGEFHDCYFYSLLAEPTTFNLFNLRETARAITWEEVFSEKIISNNSPILMVDLMSLGGFTEWQVANYRVTLKVLKMNKPDVQLTITGIYFNAPDVEIKIDKRNVLSLEVSTFDRSDLKFPSFGIISNTGNIEINDHNESILLYAQKNWLGKGSRCILKLRNTLVNGATETIGDFETDQWNYDNDSKVANVSLKDDLEEWQDINVPEINYDPRDNYAKPFSWLYKKLWILTSFRRYNQEVGQGNYNMIAFGELDEQTKNILNNTYIQYPLLKSGSLWKQWTKLCQACQLHIYKNNNGVVVCRYNGGD